MTETSKAIPSAILPFKMTQSFLKICLFFIFLLQSAAGNSSLMLNFTEKTWEILTPRMLMIVKRNAPKKQVVNISHLCKYTDLLYRLHGMFVNLQSYLCMLEFPFFLLISHSNCNIDGDHECKLLKTSEGQLKTEPKKGAISGYSLKNCQGKGDFCFSFMCCKPCDGDYISSICQLP